MSKYKNIASRDQAIPGVGIVKAGETVELPDSFHNANFERQEKKKVYSAPSNKIINNTPKKK
jgi:hypothetical protein